MSGTALAPRSARAHLTHVALVAGSALGVALVMLWPALIHSGVLAHRDLLILDRIPLSRSTWWMGPDLGRRTPPFAPLAVASGLVGGTVVGRVLLSASIVLLAVGVGLLIEVLVGPTVSARWRWCAPTIGGVAAVASPFFTTRLSTGHLTTVWAVAVLPFLLRAAVRTDPDAGQPLGRHRTCAIAALAGFVAGIYALVVVAAAATRRSWRADARGWAVRHAVWVLPGVFLQLQGFSSFTDARFFRPRLRAVGDLLGLVVGRGYWDPGAETVRGHDVAIAIGALALVALAAIGWATVARRARRIFGVCLAVGYGLPVFAVAPGTARLTDVLVTTPLGAPLREPHRMVGLALVPMIAMAACGALSLPGLLGQGVWRRWARPVGATLAAACVGWVLVAALPTVHVRLTPLALPASWGDAQRLVDAEGGTVLVLPWSEYVLLEIGKPRLVYHPLADLFGADTLASSDPALSAPVNESADARSAAAGRAAQLLEHGEDARAALAEVGVRWVAVLKVEHFAGVPPLQQPGLEPRITSPTLDLFEVSAPGAAHPDRPLPFVIRHAVGPTDVPWTWGWVGGGAHRSPGGLTVVDGTAVFVPALAGIACLSLTTWLALGRRRRISGAPRRRGDRRPATVSQPSREV